MGEDRLILGAQSDLSIFKDTMVEMTWMEVKEAAERGDAVLFPIGVIEEHGPHMDLSPDVYIACLFCKFLKQNLEKKSTKTIIAPPYYWGIAEDTKKYPGTFSVRASTFKAMLVDIFTSLHSWGFKNIFIINAHGDPLHIATIEASIGEIREALDLHVYNMSNLNIEVETPPVFPQEREGKYTPDFHAGANETATMFTFYPQKVNTQEACVLKPQSTFDPLGYCGDPAGYCLEDKVIEYFQADIEMDSLKIEAVLGKMVPEKNQDDY